LPRRNRLQGWPESRNTHGDEFSYDEEDNWIPHTTAWEKFAARDWVEPYVELIAKEVGATFQRACDYSNAGELSPVVTATRTGKPFSLSTVETLWEFPSENPIADVFAIGAKLMQLKRAGGIARESMRIRNSPCIVVPIAQGVKLKLYAKTNRRIRFEIVQSGLGKQFPQLIEAAHGLSDPWDGAANWGKSGFVPPLLNRSWDTLPAILMALRHRAAKHMNQVMTELQKGRISPVKACSVVNLLAELAAAVPRGFKNKVTRRSEIRDLLFMLCYQRGFRGNRKEGPLAEAIAELARNLHFISGLMEARIEFLAVDNPTANRLTVQILAAVAEEEARAISSRTKAALASAKARGVVLGKHGAKLGKANHKKAMKVAGNLTETIAALNAEGISTVREITAALNVRGIPTPQGKQWHSTSVHRLLKRIEQLA